jgi:hypothetical protein
MVVPKYLNFATFSNDSLAILMFWFCPEFGWRDIIIYTPSYYVRVSLCSAILSKYRPCDGPIPHTRGRTKTSKWIHRIGSQFWIATGQRASSVKWTITLSTDVKTSKMGIDT